MRTLSVLLTATLALVLVPSTRAGADEPVVVATALSVSTRAGYAGTTAPVAAVLTADDGTAVAAAPVTLDRRDDGAWVPLTQGVTDASGGVALEATRMKNDADNRLRVSYAGDDTHAPTSEVVALPLVRRTSALTITGARTVEYGGSATLTFAWRTKSGEPVGGAVRVVRRTGSGAWKAWRVLRTGADGAATVRVTPDASTRWRAMVAATDWTGAARSAVHVLTVVPPMDPVELPAAAPRPRVHVPVQPDAVGHGAHPVTTRIPAGVWRTMTVRSWHEGCPVGREGLRLLRINYWGYDGYAHRGMLVAATGGVGAMSRALAAMFRGGLPIRSLYPVDRFGWSKKLQGGNDYRSMAAGNTSAFNCRWVTNRPGVRSPHSYGRALDLNTWENPYRSATGLVPNTWWQGHSHPLVAWRSAKHRVVRIMIRAGLRWTYGLGDTQHFDVSGGSGRVRLDPACADVVCE